MMPDNDWRRQGQAKYLKGVELVQKCYKQFEKIPNGIMIIVSFVGQHFPCLMLLTI
jgi:hypothetical protein